MKKLICTLITMVSINSYAASDCRDYTQEQYEALHLAYVIGSPHDLGYTLAAITERESFVGDYIVKINPSDGKNGSYGITHVMLDTAMWLEGEKSIWKAKAEIAPKLMYDDVYALNLALRKLETVREPIWTDWVARYNGIGKKAREYAKGIAKNVSEYKRCGTFWMY